MAHQKSRSLAGLCFVLFIIVEATVLLPCDAKFSARRRFPRHTQAPSSGAPRSPAPGPPAAPAPVINGGDGKPKSNDVHKDGCNCPPVTVLCNGNHGAGGSSSYQLVPSTVTAPQETVYLSYSTPQVQQTTTNCLVQQSTPVQQQHVVLQQVPQVQQQHVLVQQAQSQTPTVSYQVVQSPAPQQQQQLVNCVVAPQVQQQPQVVVQQVPQVQQQAQVILQQVPQVQQHQPQVVVQQVPQVQQQPQVILQAAPQVQQQPQVILQQAQPQTPTVSYQVVQSPAPQQQQQVVNCVVPQVSQPPAINYLVAPAAQATSVKYVVAPSAPPSPPPVAPTYSYVVAPPSPPPVAPTTSIVVAPPSPPPVAPSYNYVVAPPAAPPAPPVYTTYTPPASPVIDCLPPALPSYPSYPSIPSTPASTHLSCDCTPRYGRSVSPLESRLYEPIGVLEEVDDEELMPYNRVDRSLHARDCEHYQGPVFVVYSYDGVNGNQQYSDDVQLSNRFARESVAAPNYRPAVGSGYFNFFKLRQPASQQESIPKDETQLPTVPLKPQPVKRTVEHKEEQTTTTHQPEYLITGATKEEETTPEVPKSKDQTEAPTTEAPIPETTTENSTEIPTTTEIELKVDSLEKIHEDIQKILPELELMESIMTPTPSTTETNFFKSMPVTTDSR